MSTLSKQNSVSSPAASLKGSGNTLPTNGYIPSGVMLATILKALRDAQDNDLEMQQQQAEVEQDYYKQLGGLNGNDISKGLIAMVAKSTAQAGEDEADGLKAQGLSSAINAGLSGASTVGVLGYSGYKTREISKLDDEIKENQDFGRSLDKPTDADLTISSSKKAADQELEIEMQNLDSSKIEKTKPEVIEALKADGQTQRLKDMNEEKLKDLRRQQDDYSASINLAQGSNQSFGSIVQAATQAASSYKGAESKINAASDNASATVQKQVQDMNYSSANTFKQQAESSAQQAMQIADALSQVAQSQVQFRG